MERADVVVVGAGLAGLSVADRLAREGVGVVVLEARHRIGGRLLTEELGAARFDLGGQWIGPAQRRVHALAEELSLATFPTHHAGDKILWLDGKARRYAGTIPKLDPLSLVELQLTLSRIDRMRKRVAMERPAGDDHTTLGDWQRRHVRSRSVRALMDAAVRVVFGVEPRELSMLTFLFYLQGGGGLMPLIEIEGGAQQTRFVDGAQRLAYGLAERLGRAVRVACPVRRIDATEEASVRVIHDGGEHTAKRVVVAIPPALARRIDFAPALPTSRRRLLDRCPTGATTKHVLLYDRAFWRGDGLSGEVVCDDGPFSVAFDNSNGDQPALLAFSVGQAARQMSALAPDERHRRVRERLAACFGPAADRPTLHVEKDWAREPWSRGCPVGLALTGVLDEHADALRRPCGAIHWAGTETAREHHGFLEGALESAERAAREVIAAL